MIKNASVIACLPAEDIDRAHRFYTETLGFPVLMQLPDGGYLLEAGSGTHFLVYPTQFAGTAQHTVACFQVDDLTTEVTGLKSKGITSPGAHTPLILGSAPSCG